MASQTRYGGKTDQNRWNVVTQALLVGYVAWNALLWLALDLGRHSPEVPTGAAQPVAWVVSIGIIGYLLIRQEFKAGYVLSIVTPILGVVALALIAVGPHGPIPGDPAAPVLWVGFGPGGYVGFSVILVVATVLAWQSRDDIQDTEVHEHSVG